VKVAVILPSAVFISKLSLLFAMTTTAVSSGVNATELISVVLGVVSVALSFPEDAVHRSSFPAPVPVAIVLPSDA
jgi:hypothetical protein